MRTGLCKTAFFTLVLAFVPADILFAADAAPEKISWGFLIVGVFGGLALFLYGMEKMSEGMKKSAGNKMRSVLAALTKNRVIGLLVGAFVTMVIQSSSATTVMLVSFVQAGLVSFAQSLGVILGADIGTTITAQLIAFKLTDYAMLMIAVGVGMRMFAKSENLKNIGEVVLGFGILFYGMKLMSDAMKPLRTYSNFINLLEGLENPVLGLLIGAVFTALIQSSSAFTGILIVLAQQGLISLEAGIPLIFGANIGTCITAGLASIGTSREAKRVALAHVIFKVAGVALFFFWIPAFADVIRALANSFGSGTARQIANAHTIFNVSLGLFFLPCTMVFAKLVTRILPDRKTDMDLKPATWHLDDSQISTPAVAIDLSRAEISRMAKLLGRMQRAIIVPFLSEEPRRDDFFPQLSLLEGIKMREAKINFLEKKITEYLLQVAKQELSEEQSNEVYEMISIVKDIESIGDIIDRNMIPMIPKKHALKSDFSHEGKEELLIYHEKVCKQLHLLKKALAERNPAKARLIMAKERKYLDLESQYRILHLERIRHQRRESLETHAVHLELMDLMKQIIVYSSNIAQTFLAKFEQQQKPLKQKDTLSVTATWVEQPRQQALPADMNGAGSKPQAKGSPTFDVADIL
ncbi:MAG: Na/Pi cotransporter family protein [Desulfobacterales bacterium]|nr:MAG: Na/Pi cotransporter family protein [Desulfobacterales bacterium]